MKALKRIIALMLLGILVFSLCGCGESDSAKLARLESEAASARQRANEARDNYNTLKNFSDKYGN